jgi:hypothetical protein
MVSTAVSGGVAGRPASDLLAEKTPTAFDLPQL